MVELYLTRRILTAGDSMLDSVPVWHRDGVPFGRAVLVNHLDLFGTEIRLSWQSVAKNSSYVGTYAGKIRIPIDTPPGDYFLVLGHDDYRTPVRILERKERRPVRFHPGMSCFSADCVQRALDKRDELLFDPGEYFFDTSIRLPPGSRIRGFNTRFNLAATWTGGTDCMIEGCEFSLPSDDHLLFLNADMQTNLTMRECTFSRGGFGWPFQDCYFENCVWDGGGIADGAPHGHYHNCLFKDNATAHAFALRGPCVGRYAMTDCTFAGTDRGPVHRCLAGDVADNLIVGLHCKDIRRDQNGNEMVSAEGNLNYGFDRNLVVGSRIGNCDGNFFLPWDANARDNRLIDTVVRGGGGFWLAGLHDMNAMTPYAEQSGNVYEQFELHDTDGIRFGWRDGYGRLHGEGIRNNTIRNGAILGFRPSRVNQGVYNPDTYARLDWLHVLRCGSGNRIHDVVCREGGQVQTVSREVEASMV